MENINIYECQKRYILPTYPEAELILVKGQGAYVRNDKGREYLDFTCGIGVCNLGHCHRKVTSEISAQATELMHVSNLFMTRKQPLLAKKIIDSSFSGRVFFANSGSEANEGMIKFARKWGNKRGRNKIITMNNSFHGRSLATLAATGKSIYRKGFKPKTQGFIEIPFNDFRAVKEAYYKSGKKIAAVLLEPIQGEGGVIPADNNYIGNLRKFCTDNDILLMLDEVQTGMGRTGEFFAYKHYNIEPDLMSMAKGLGNGFPIGAFAVNDSVENVLTPGTHASTFGGSPLACSAAIAVFDAIYEENLLSNTAKMGGVLMEELNKLKKVNSSIRAIRGKGLMVGIEFATDVKKIIYKAREEGLLLIPAGKNVIRFYPPLNVTAEELIDGLNIFKKIIKVL
ncbi:MAG: aspartate aminotransferase family protein [Victivallales bacterium]|nr:aspartate aminotransferase family protein [Victivallales bacterium]